VLTYVCDWCKRAKTTRQRWILGFAAADHRLAVHFCCEEHMQAYINALFAKPVQRRQRASRGSGAQAGPVTVPAEVAPAPRRSRPAGERPAAAPRSADKFDVADQIRFRGLGIRMAGDPPPAPSNVVSGNPKAGGS